MLTPSFSTRTRVLTALLLAGFAVVTTAQADSVFETNFANGTLDHLGWVNQDTKDTNWRIVDYQADHPTLMNGPGPVVGYPANGKDTGLLVKKFTAVSKPGNLTLTFDAGWGWGQAGQADDCLNIMLLDDDGNGYIFEVHRTKATWAAQWGVVTKYIPPQTLNWSPTVIDATQKAVIDGGGLQTFTITRDSNGAWSLSGAKWTGDTTSFKFQDGGTTTFSQVVLYGVHNIDDILFNKIKLDVSP